MLRDLSSERSIHLHGVAIVTKDKRGKLSMNVVADEGPKVAAAGALIGGLAGLAIGPLAAAILATGGAVAGASAGLTNRGAALAFAQQIADDLQEHSVAVVAEVTTEGAAAIAARLTELGAKITQEKLLGNRH